MSIPIPLDEMSLHEKLAAMELLWDDLVRSPELVASPDWHEGILADRGEQIESHTSRFTDWETAKSEIRNRMK